MSLGAAVTLIMIGAGAVQFLVVASFALARRRLHLTWLAANCVVATGYSAACFLSAMEPSAWMPRNVIWHCGHLGYSMSALYFSTMIHFLNLSLDREPPVWEKWVHYSLAILSVVIWIPGLFFRPGELREWEYLWTTYSFPESNFLIWVCGGILFAGIATLVGILLKCSRAFQLSGLFFVLCATSDVCVALGVWEVTWVAALGLLVFLAVLSQHEAKAWAAEANLLTEVKVTLESRVAESSAELAASRDELAQHERLAALGRLAASVGHEINNPLTYVICNLELLRMKYADSDQLIGDAVEGANRIARIVEELRCLSRPESESRRELLDFSDVLQRAEKTLRHRLSDSKQIRIDCLAGCYVTGDPDRLTQLMVNLLSNALSALPDDDLPRVVEANTYSTDDEVVVTIRDEGCGIPQSIQERLFEPFITTRKDGLGLGLAICRTIVKEAGGQLNFSSRENQGTTFEVRFPKGDGAIAQSGRQGLANLQTSSQCRVLVVDDEPAVLASFERMLGKCQVTTASSGKEALLYLESEEYDVVFCDLVMEGISGIDVLNQAQLNGTAKFSKFVLMSGGNPNHDVDCEEIVEVPFLQKPFGIADVTALLPDVGGTLPDDKDAGRIRRAKAS